MRRRPGHRTIYYRRAKKLYGEDAFRCGLSSATTPLSFSCRKAPPCSPLGRVPIRCTPIEPGRRMAPGWCRPVPCRSGTICAAVLGRLPRAVTPDDKRPSRDFQGILLPSLVPNSFPSDRRVVSEDTGDGGGGPIFSSIWQPPAPLRPPLRLLPEPRQVRVNGVSSAHHMEVGGASCSFP